MHTPKEPDRRVLELADLQAGVISHDQLKRIGHPPGSLKRWRRGWTRLATGVHCLRPPTWESWAWAGVLYADGVVGGMAAAHLHGFVQQAPPQITVWHTHTGSLSSIGDETAAVTFKRGRRQGVGDPVRTRLEQTLVDLTVEADEDQVVSAVARAFAKRMTAPGRVRAAMERCKRMRYRKLLEELLEEVTAGVESVLEWRFLQVVIRAHGLPEPMLQPSIVFGTRSDGLFEEYGVVLELDGALGHEEAFRDMARDNRLAVRGLVTLRYGWHDVIHRPCEVARQVRVVLQARGYEDAHTSCHRCKLARMG